MNARQMKKCLKKRINRLESDNDLMRRIIADSPTMQELYDLFNKSVNVHHTTMEFQEYKVKKLMPFYYMNSEIGFINHVKRAMAKDLFEGIKDNISYDVNSECGLPIITASIFVGRM